MQGPEKFVNTHSILIHSLNGHSLLRITAITTQSQQSVQTTALRLSKHSLDPRPSWPREGLGNNLTRKCLAGMPRFLNPTNFIFRSSMRLVRYYSNFQNFYPLLYIHFLPLVELERLLAHQHRRSIPALKTLPGKVIPQTLLRAARRVWGPD